MKLNRSLIAAPLLALVLFTQACSFNAARELRLVLAASGPLIESLNLGGNKGAIVADFTDLANGAATMAQEFDRCASDKPCKLNAVSAFQAQFDVVEARGHFGVHPKLQTVEGILRGIVASAKIYYGGSSSGGPESLSKRRAQGPSVAPVSEQDLKAQIESLKAAMKP